MNLSKTRYEPDSHFSMYSKVYILFNLYNGLCLLSFYCLKQSSELLWETCFSSILSNGLFSSKSEKREGLHRQLKVSIQTLYQSGKGLLFSEMGFKDKGDIPNY